MNRAGACRKVVTLSKPGVVLVVSRRERPAPGDPPTWPKPLGEIGGLARHQGLAMTTAAPSRARLSRPNVAIAVRDWSRR